MTHRQNKKQSRYPRIRMALRKRLAIPSIIATLAIVLIVFFHFTDTRKTRGASNGDYRTIASGNWNATSILFNNEKQVQKIVKK